MYNNLMKYILIASSICVCQAAFSTIYPLHYNATQGLYSVKLYVGKQQQPLYALVDTGSSNLNFISTSTKCSDCIFFINNNLLNIAESGIKQLYKDSFYGLRYGTGSGVLQAYSGKVGLSPTTQVPTEFSVYTTGTHVSNILGLAYKNIAVPALYPLQPYFDAIIKHAHLNGFALRLNGLQAPSSITIGLDNLFKTLKPQHVHYAPIVTNKYYVTLLDGIYGVVNNKRQRIISYSSPITKTAIVDSGTGGYIILPAYDRQQVVNYISKHTPQKLRQRLGNAFWKDNLCINNSYIDFKQFPNISFALAKSEAIHKSIFITLKPHDYITSGGCGRGSSHLAFSTMNTAQKRKLPRKYVNDYPSLKILGTPFMEHRLVIFDRSPRTKTQFGQIGFSDTL